METKNYATIAGFEELTPLQVWQMAYDHVNQTKEKSVIPGTDVCAYGGVGCAASVFLKEEYRDQFDRLKIGGWGSLYDSGRVPGTNVVLIMNIQRCHDGAPADDRFLELFNREMKDIKPKEDIVK